MLFQSIDADRLACLQRAPADIAAAEPFGPVDRIDHPIGAGPCLGQRGPPRGDVQHPPAVGQKAPALGLGSGVEGHVKTVFGQGIKATDFGAFLRRAGIALRRHDHGHGELSDVCQPHSNEK